MSPFTLGQVLSVTTGRLLCPFGEVHQILDHLTGEALMTHQLPRACREAAPRILERYPQLADVDVPDELDSAETVTAWLDQQAPTLGATFDLDPLSTDDHTRIDPISELRMMRPDMPIVVVELGAEEGP